MHYHRVCMHHQQHGGGQPSSHSYRKGTVKRSRKKCLNWQILLVPPRARAVCTSERGYVSRNLHLVRAVGHPHILRWRTAKQPELQQKEASELAKSPRSAKSKSCGESRALGALSPLFCVLVPPCPSPAPLSFPCHCEVFGFFFLPCTSFLHLTLSSSLSPSFRSSRSLPCSLWLFFPSPPLCPALSHYFCVSGSLCLSPCPCCSRSSFLVL